MWSEVVEKVKTLSILDYNKSILGASNHNYTFGKKLTDKYLSEIEKKLDCKLPLQLRAFYLEVGNGGAGPDLGVKSIEQISYYNPDKKWEGVEDFDLSDGEANGLLGIINMHYNHEALVVTKGTEEGYIVESDISAGWMTMTSFNLITFYNSWLDKKIEYFNICKRLIQNYDSVDDILSELQVTFRFNNEAALTLIASLLKVELTEFESANYFHRTKISSYKYEFHLSKECSQYFNSKLELYRSDSRNMQLTTTDTPYTHMNFLAIDVYYENDIAYVAGIVFNDWLDTGCPNYKTKVVGVEKYTPGEFYRRELPCILKLIEEHKLKPDCIIIDGYVFLENNTSGLGKYLYDALNGMVPVIGVAKNPRGEMPEKLKVYRGESKKPLFITSVGIEVELSKKIIKNMQGAYRMPDALKSVDTFCRRTELYR